MFGYYTPAYPHNRDNSPTLHKLLSCFRVSRTSSSHFSPSLSHEGIYDKFLLLFIFHPPKIAFLMISAVSILITPLHIISHHNFSLNFAHFTDTYHPAANQEGAIVRICWFSFSFLCLHLILTMSSVCQDGVKGSKHGTRKVPPVNQEFLVSSSGCF